MWSSIPINYYLLLSSAVCAVWCLRAPYRIAMSFLYMCGILHRPRLWEIMRHVTGHRLGLSNVEQKRAFLHLKSAYHLRRRRKFLWLWADEILLHETRNQHRIPIQHQNRKTRVANPRQQYCERSRVWRERKGGLAVKCVLTKMGLHFRITNNSTHERIIFTSSSSQSGTIAYCSAVD